MGTRMHPDGMARLVAAILIEGDREKVHGRATDEQILDARVDQVLGLAREHYKVYPCDFDVSREGWRLEAVRNAKNNLAKLNRANLR